MMYYILRGGAHTSNSFYCKLITKANFSQKSYHCNFGFRLIKTFKQ
jgi:hypothetical protein